MFLGEIETNMSELDVIRIDTKIELLKGGEGEGGVRELILN